MQYSEEQYIINCATRGLRARETDDNNKRFG